MTLVVAIDPNNPRREEIARAAEVIKKGGLVAFPTETVYGLGANFFDKNAIKKLCEVKQRPQGKPFSAHIADVADLARLDCDISPLAKAFIENFWPGPLTLIFDTKRDGKVGFRFPDHKVAQELIRQSATFIAAPSANLSGGAPPLDAQEVLRQLKDKIDLILDAGKTPLGKESTVVDVAVSPYAITREGAISRQQLAGAEERFWKDTVGPAIKGILFVCTGNSCRSVMAEGYLKKRLKEVERDDIEVSSRGVRPALLLRPIDQTLEVLQDIGVDASGHRTARLSVDDIEMADLILVMEAHHRDEILRMAPSSKHKVYLLAEFGRWGGSIGDSAVEVEDPIGRPVEKYREVLGAIRDSVERLVAVVRGGR